jgi:nucleotide-binding universal stress UspA family protein
MCCSRPIHSASDIPVDAGTNVTQLGTNATDIALRAADSVWIVDTLQPREPTMRETHFPAPSVVVGIDGSRAAVRAALWAVDEAVSRDIPLRLICAIPQGGTAQIDSQGEAHKLATAELAIRSALMAVESLEKPVKIEVEIVQGPPARTLIDASGSAAMVCVGAIGLAHAAPGGVGSTAAAVAASAHCPVAIIRGRDRPSAADRGTILVYLGTSPDDGSVLQAAVEQAQLRGMRLQPVTAWQSRASNLYDSAAVAVAKRQVLAQLDRRLERWVQRYPDLEMSSVAVHGSLLDHLANNSDSIQLVVMGTRHDDVAELVGPAGTAVLHSTDCSVLIVGRQHT